MKKKVIISVLGFVTLGTVFASNKKFSTSYDEIKQIDAANLEKDMAGLRAGKYVSKRLHHERRNNPNSIMVKLDPYVEEASSAPKKKNVRWFSNGEAFGEDSNAVSRSEETYSKEEYPQRSQHSDYDENYTKHHIKMTPEEEKSEGMAQMQAKMERMKGAPRMNNVRAHAKKTLKALE